FSAFRRRLSMKPKPSEKNAGERLWRVAQMIKGLGEPPNVGVLLQLEEALYRSDEPLSDEKRKLLVENTAVTIAAQTRSAIELIAQALDYETVRRTLLAQWSEVPFPHRMLF